MTKTKGAPYGASQFRDDMAALGGSKEVAALLCVTPRACQLWAAGDRPVPPLVARAMSALASGIIRLQDWRGLP